MFTEISIILIEKWLNMKFKFIKIRNSIYDQL